MTGTLRVLAITLVSASALAIAWGAHAYFARDPYKYVLAADPKAWQSDAGLQRAVAKLPPLNRNLLRLWMVQHSATPRSRTCSIREAITEVQTRARTEPLFRAAVDLYAKPRSDAGKNTISRFAGRSTP